MILYIRNMCGLLIKLRHWIKMKDSRLVRKRIVGRAHRAVSESASSRRNISSTLLKDQGSWKKYHTSAQWTSLVLRCVVELDPKIPNYKLAKLCKKQIMQNISNLLFSPKSKLPKFPLLHAFWEHFFPLTVNTEQKTHNLIF